MTGSINGTPSLGWGDPLSDFYPTTAQETLSGLDRVFASAPRVWMLRIYDTVVDPDGVIRKYFAEHATLIDDTVYAGEANARVQGFLTTRELAKDIPATAVRSNHAFAGRVTLLGYQTEDKQLRAGNEVNIALYWRAEQPLNYNYHVSLQILGPAEQKIGQLDEEPLGNTLPMTRWEPGKVYPEPMRLRIDPNAAPGEYSARVVVYNPASGESLGEPASIGAITVK
jgi:hypothetical protein